MLLLFQIFSTNFYFVNFLNKITQLNKEEINNQNRKSPKIDNSWKFNNFDNKINFRKGNNEKDRSFNIVTNNFNKSKNCNKEESKLKLTTETRNVMLTNVDKIIISENLAPEERNKVKTNDNKKPMISYKKFSISDIFGNKFFIFKNQNEEKNLNFKIIRSLKKLYQKILSIDTIMIKFYEIEFLKFTYLKSDGSNQDY